MIQKKKYAAIATPRTCAWAISFGICPSGTAIGTSMVSSLVMNSGLDYIDASSALSHKKGEGDKALGHLAQVV